MAKFDPDSLRWFTPAEAAEEVRRRKAEHEELLSRWPRSHWRARCLACGCFMPKGTDRRTRCKRCGESYDSLQ